MAFKITVLFPRNLIHTVAGAMPPGKDFVPTCGMVIQQSALP